MPVFTALRNKARSTASGFLTKTAQNALGLNRAKGLRFNQPNTGPVTGNAQTTRGGEVLQYPLDLGTDGNSHFIAFFVKQIESPKAELASPEVIKKRKNKKRQRKIQALNLGAALKGEEHDEDKETLPKGHRKEIKLLTQKNLGKKLMMLIGKHLGQVRNIYQYKRKLDLHQN